MNAHKNDAPAWYDELVAPPFENESWSRRDREAFLNRIGSPNKVRCRRPIGKTFPLSIVFLAIMLVSVTWLIERSGTSVLEGSRSAWQVHREYRMGGELQWEVFPGGELTAGKPAGAGWIFNRPIDRMLGHSIRIEANHEATGMTLVELPETKIDRSNAQAVSYTGIKEKRTRIVTDMAIPLGGKWRFSLFLDGQPYGDAVIEVQDGGWAISSTFRSDRSELTGTEGKIGFIGGDFIAGQGNKYLWHFWGSDEELTGNLQIYGVQQQSLQMIPLFTVVLQPSPLNGADASLPSGFALPSPGIWKLVAVIDGKWFGNVVVDVQKRAGGSF